MNARAYFKLYRNELSAGEPENAENLMYIRMFDDLCEDVKQHLQTLNDLDPMLREEYLKGYFVQKVLSYNDKWNEIRHMQKTLHNENSPDKRITFDGFLTEVMLWMMEFACRDAREAEE